MKRLFIIAAMGIFAAIFCRPGTGQVAPSCDTSGLGDIYLKSIEGTLLHPLTIPITLQVNCKDLDPNHPLGYCMSISNNPADIGSGMLHERVLWRFGAPISSNSHMPFNFYKEDGTVWGGGSGLMDYGKPLTGMTGSDSGDKTYNIPISVTLDDKPGPMMLGGPHSNYFQVAMGYSSDNVNPSNLDSLCNRSSGAQFAAPGFLQVRADIENACNVNVTKHVSFGQNWSLDAVQPTVGTITAACTKGTAYQIGLSSGNYPSGGRRAMKCGTSDTCGSDLVYYDLYKDGAYSQIWNDKWDTNGILKDKSEDSTVQKPYTVYAKLYPGQKADNGAYRDTIIVTIRVDNAPGSDG